VRRVLTIGPSDSSGVTGIQADLRVFAELGVAGFSAVTEVRAVEDGRVRRRFAVPPRVVEAQIDAVARGGVDATKIAALSDQTLVEALAARVRRRRLAPLVLDPGIVDASGERVLGRKGVEWLRKRLLPLVTVLVLRGVEAEILTGEALGDDAARERALEQVRRGGVAAVLLCVPGESPDWLADAEGIRPIPAAIPGGGGPRERFTAALTARLALGDGAFDATRFAADFVRRESAASEPR
jgi:hydroxymethylpyrimidine/phosphomethylpyrimidine kinase